MGTGSMIRSTLALLFAAALAPGGVLAEPSPAGEMRRIARSDLEDKIRGGWAGQMIGVSYGAPTEFKSNGKIITDDIGGYRDWTPERLREVIAQDDLYVEMTFAQVMDERGLDATSEQYGEVFKNSKYRLWHANSGARWLLNNGVKAPMSGHPRHNVHANDIDFQIESDFIGLMTPGLPAEANRYADRVGRVMNWGDGLYGGMFVAGMYSAAFFETDPRRVVERGLRSIPKDSSYAEIVRDVLRWSAENPDDWTKTWALIEAKWNKHDSCPEGAVDHLNIDAKLNGAYVVLGLLYGRGDMERTLDVATRAGQDSDCNPSSAAGILGVMLGYRNIPAKWRAGVPAIADTKFQFTNYSFSDIVASTLVRALKVVGRAGGRVTADAVLVPVQQPTPPPLEQWEMGPMLRVAAVDGPDWAFSGAVDARTRKFLGKEAAFRILEGEGRARLRFVGGGVAIQGVRVRDGGRAQVLLDGEPAGRIDAWAGDEAYENNLWHVTGLSMGEHVVELVPVADRDARSTGGRVPLVRAVVYGQGRFVERR